MKKVTAVLMSLILGVGVMFVGGQEVKAADVETSIVSETEEESELVVTPRGVYLGSGKSSISKVGTGRIAAGGTTVGQSIVSQISVTVRVERLINGTWTVYTSWTATNYNAASVTSSKTLSVPTGYYYRTHCTHRANSDVSGSVTNGIYI